MKFIRRVPLCLVGLSLLAAGFPDAAHAEEATSRFAPLKPLRMDISPSYMRANIPAPTLARWDPARARRMNRRRFSLELELGPLWQSRNDAAIPGDTGTRFDLTEVTGTGPFPAGRIIFDWRIRGRHSVRALIAPLQISETGVLNQNVSFNGVNFAAGASTKATYKFNSYRIGYRYLLFCGRCWDLNVGATLKVRDAKIELQQGATSSVKNDLGIVPLLHIDFEWRFRPGWRFVADLDGAAAPQGRAFDLALKVHRDISERWSVGVGYRTLEGGADNDTVYTFAWTHQALVSLSYRF